MRVPHMRRILIVLTLVLAGTQLRAWDRQVPKSGPMLTVDSIMRGPKLVGNPPSAVRWSKDSSKVYFSWQKASEDRANTYAVNRDGSGLRELSPEEGRN